MDPASTKKSELRATIEDLGSKNGTFVRDIRIESPVALQPGDPVRIGRVGFVFRTESGGGLTETDAVSRESSAGSGLADVKERKTNL